MSLAILDPALHSVLGDPKKTTGGERRARESAANVKPTPMPKRRKIKKFPVKAFNYEISK